MRLDFGTPVTCIDGAFGELADVVVDPATKRVTHLVVKPRHEEDVARLVPAELAEESDARGSTIFLRCSVAEAGRFQNVHRQAYLPLAEVPHEDAQWDVGAESVFLTPYADELVAGGMADIDSYGVAYDRVPHGEIEIRRGSQVLAADGEEVGRVDEVVIDADRRVTELVVTRGFLWWRRAKRVPLRAVAGLSSDTVTLKVTGRDVARLP